MPYALDTSTGVVVGSALGFLFTAALETAGQFVAATVDDLDQAESWRVHVKAVLNDETVRIVEVASGHWHDLQRAGLNVYDMPTNELLYHPAKGSA